MGYALITGASKGIGKCLAIEIAKRGYGVLLIARSESLLKELSIDLQNKFKVEAQYLPLDLSLPGAAQKINDWCHSNTFQVEILINNAGYGLSGAFEKYSLKEYTDMMQVNMHVPVELCWLFLPQLKQRTKAYILNISSSAAYQAVPGLNVYAATKAFILSFSRGLRWELRNSPVVVSCICPGATDTNFVNQAHMGEKARKLAEKVNMSAEKVAQIAIKGMFREKAEMIPGFINKVGAFLTWALPKSVVEKGALKIYQP